MPIVYLGIGSNLGNRKENCLNALRLLAAKSIGVAKQSSLYETRPWGVIDQPEFINMAAEIMTDMPPVDLLGVLKGIEKALGREDTGRWGPRTIDLDILFYDDLVLETPDLRIPHPLMHLREFVLRPLSEIAPDKVHPVLKKTVRELLEEVDGQ